MLPFIDLAAQRRRLGSAIDTAISRVLAHGQFILGPEVEEFERDLAAYARARHAVTCASGTDALVLALRAVGIGPGDAVVCPSFTFCATAEVAVLVGATPIFADVSPDTFNISADAVIGAVEAARARGLTAKAVIPVDLFGLPADHDGLAAVAKNYNLFVIDDAAQAFGATYRGRPLGTFGTLTCTSFFPAKPLGCYGDGGAVLTDDDDLAKILRSLRVHGQGSNKYDNVRIGLASRLDTIQAAVLREKLKIFPDEIEARELIARRYAAGLGDVVQVPAVPDGLTSVWAQYTVRTHKGGRDGLATALKAAGIPTAIYYPVPLHRQVAYKDYPVGRGGLEASESLAEEVISLPMHPYLEEATQAQIIETARRTLRCSGKVFESGAAVGSA